MQRSPLIGYVFTAVVLIGALALIRHHDDTLRYGDFTSGYLLIGGVLFLAAFNLRKRLSFLPLGRASTWLQLHILVGVIAIMIFAVHVDFQLPTGRLERILFFLFVSTSTSGIYGLTLSRSIPAKLSKLREEVIYERIPGFRAQVRRQAHAEVVSLITELPADTVADFYTTRLCEYFVQPRNLLYFLHPTSKLRNQLRGELAGLSRYCSDIELAASDKLGRLIDQRDDLDYHEALQGKLKVWLFLHIALTYALVLVGLFHGIMAHAFRGGVI